MGRVHIVRGAIAAASFQHLLPPSAGHGRDLSGKQNYGRRRLCAWRYRRYPGAAHRSGAGRALASEHCGREPGRRRWQYRGGAGRAPTPDGYTLLATTTALAINETLHKDNQFASTDFTTVAIAASSPEALATSPSNPAKNLADFVKAAHGKTINFGSAGVGSGSHIEAEYFFKFLAKVPAVHIPFQGGAPAINATIGNQIDLLATTLGGGAAAQIAGGKLKGLGIAADKRAAVVPDVPTYAEQGFPGFTATWWVDFFAPAKTDPHIVATLNAAINDIVKYPAVQAKLTSIGFDPITGSQPQADAMFKDEVQKWGKMVKALNLSIN